MSGSRQISLAGYRTLIWGLEQVEQLKENTGGPFAQSLLWFRWRTNTEQVHTSLNPLCITVTYICWTRSVAGAWPLTPFDPKRDWWLGNWFFQLAAKVIIILILAFLLVIDGSLSVRQWKKCFLYYWTSTAKCSSFFPPTVGCLTSFGTTFPVMRKVLLFTSCGRIVTFPAGRGILFHGQLSLSMKKQPIGKE